MGAISGGGSRELHSRALAEEIIEAANDDMNPLSTLDDKMRVFDGMPAAELNCVDQ